MFAVQAKDQVAFFLRSKLWQVMSLEQAIEVMHDGGGSTNARGESPQVVNDS